MAQKNNIRSIRFSDELADLIDRQIGRNFTEKFETLVTRCVWELPQKEQQLQNLDKQIQRKREQLNEISTEVMKLNSTLQEITYRTDTLKSTVDRELKKWET